MLEPHLPIRYVQYRRRAFEDLPGKAIVETPVSLTVNGEPWLTFLCTPTHLEALAVGFLFNEGVIENMGEVADVRPCAHGDNVDVWLTHAAKRPASWRRTSGCTGGVTSVPPTPASPPDEGPARRTNGFFLPPERVASLIEMLFDAQELYRESGGVHTSALSDGEHLIFAAEDIGRHNTLDKIAGWCLMHDCWPEQRILITTGRISSEMLQKAARMGASIVISRTAPSSLAIQLAEARGITLIGYARRDRFNLYTHPQRIASSQSRTKLAPQSEK